MSAWLPGLSIGHATDLEARTGCTVLLGPFRGACHVCGHATGTREIDALSTLHIVPRIDALLFTGGSAFGLGAADGVVAWLEAKGRGFDTGIARVPIVPAAVIFDLAVATRRPDAAMGRAACDAARPAPPARGRVGVGTGATVGKWNGPANASPGGFGWHAGTHAGWTVVAVAAVNPLGDVVGTDGRIAAGARGPAGRFLAEEGFPPTGFDGGAGPGVPANTTLAAVITDAPASRTRLEILARMASAALARRIAPAFTPFDGDACFALSTADGGAEIDARALVGLGAMAATVLEHAIMAAVAP